ncbi:hypothetical protein SCALIN_C17_0192 [Candidatus Scalindua japonica]|uniref:PKD domain-containing protein n=1 Tax=Candidatus Scalindua japonica TaxID=1284222 RepID=A0A286TZ72_9BACT|nr:hypothetical protein [Candidatus Scalindua japonica]GAX61158.1 hypothetical protein SCALIN_C17_0192 [Candidatus Scalindua japonica]
MLTGGVSLIPGKQYVAFFTTADHCHDIDGGVIDRDQSCAAHTATGGPFRIALLHWGSSFSNNTDFTGGNFVHINSFNGTSEQFSLLKTNNWTNDEGGTIGNDAFFVMTFSSSSTNTPPVAVGGSDQAARAGDTILLDGSNSFDDNTMSMDLAYNWSFSSKPVGSVAALTGEDTAAPIFVADLEGTYVVGLIVADTGALSSISDEVEISTDNLAPTADGGVDQLTITGFAVHLDGSNSSDPEANTLTFDWTITSAPVGSTAVLSNATTESPIITPDLEGVYEVTLVVSDFIGPGTSDAVEITATTADDFAEIQIVAADEIVSVLDESLSEVTNTGNQNAFGNFLTQAMVALQEDDTAKAINKIEKALARTDGCALRGEPDGNGKGRDWVTSSAA